MEEREFEDLRRELHETRAAPRPEFARELDARAAEWLRERPTRRLPSLRIAIPALATAAAAAAVVALVLSGGDDGGSAPQLEVAVVGEQGAAEALGAPLQKDSSNRAASEGGFAPPAERRVAEGEPVSLRYFFTAPTRGTVEFAGRDADVEVPEGAGRIEVSTDGLPAGTHELEIAVPAAPLYRERIELED